METSHHSQDSMNEWAGSSNEFMKEVCGCNFSVNTEVFKSPPYTFMVIIGMCNNISQLDAYEGSTT